MTVTIELWGDSHSMAPSATFDIVARGHRHGRLELELVDDGITVWGWEGSVVNIYSDGVRVDAGPEEREAVPEVPRGKRVRRFLRSLLGG